MRTKRGRAAGLLDLGVLMNSPDGGAGGSTGSAGSKEKPTLTWAQSVNRCREIEAELTRLAELDTLSKDDEDYFRSLTAEFDLVDGHRKNLERSAELERIRGAASKIDVRQGGRRTPVQPGAVAEDDYDVDVFRDPESAANARFRNPWDMRDVRTFGRSREDMVAELTSRARSAIEQMP